jgi:hypothetical protein
VEWIRHAANQVTKKSLENKVDQLWSCVFAYLFSFSKGYLIVSKDRVDGSAKSPDFTIKYLKNGVESTILVMENKRASAYTHSAVWAKAVAELDGYLDLVPEKAKLNPNLDVGLVGIGQFVRFYCRQDGGPLMDYPGSDIRPWHIMRDAKKIGDLLVVTDLGSCPDAALLTAWRSLARPTPTLRRCHSILSTNRPLQLWRAELLSSKNYSKVVDL